MASAAESDEGMNPITAMNNANYDRFHKILVLIASLGAFTDVYIIMVLSVSTFSIVPHFLITTSAFAFTASLLFVGSVFGVFIMGKFVDIFGRRIIFVVTLALAAIFSILSALVTTPLELNILRFSLGFVTGADYPAAMTIIAEFMPTKYRARGSSYLWVGFVLGGVVAYIVGYFVYIAIGPIAIEWRIMLASAAVPAMIGTLLRTKLPESPRWAIEKGKFDLAIDGIRKASGKIFTREELEKSRDILFVKERIPLKKDYGRYIILIIPIAIATLCFNLITGALGSLDPTILSSLGIKKSGTLLFSGFFMTAPLLSTLIIARTVDYVGRLKWGLIGGGFETICSLLVVSVFHNTAALMGVVFGIWFFAFLAIPIMNNAGSEMFPTEFRGFSSGIVMGGNRVSSVIGILITPILFAGNDVFRLFTVYAIIGLIGTVMVLITFYKKKVDRISLEDIEHEIMT
ncbi:MAG: MFS transporter, partial [Ferroplasma sp.]